MKYILLLVTLFCFGVNAGIVRLYGTVPTDVNAEYLHNEYVRLWGKINPHVPLDTAPVIVQFYNSVQIQQNRLPIWGGGGAIGRDSIIIPLDRIPLGNFSPTRITIHELLHILITRGYGNVKVPRWFHEGVAMTFSGELDFEEQQVISRAIITNQILPLDSIERVNSFGTFKARVAYYQSHLAVLFLITTYGIDVIPDLLIKAKHLRSFPDAVQDILGLSIQELESHIRADMNTRYRFVFFFADTYLLWGAIFVLAIIAFIVTRIRNRRKRLQLERDAEYDELNESGNTSGDEHNLTIEPEK